MQSQNTKRYILLAYCLYNFSALSDCPYVEELMWILLSGSDQKYHLAKLRQQEAQNSVKKDPCWYLKKKCKFGGEIQIFHLVADL